MPFINDLANDSEESLMSLATTIFLTSAFIPFKNCTVAIPIFSEVCSFNCSGYSPLMS